VGVRVWEWRLPDGRRVVAKLDAESGTESVFLGPRLVSRGPRGSRPDGHLVPLTPVVDAPYRGGSDAKVCFDGTGCHFVVDGEAKTPDESPPTAFSRLDQSRVDRFRRVRNGMWALMGLAVSLWTIAAVLGKARDHSPDAMPFALGFLAVTGVLGLYSHFVVRCPACKAKLASEGTSIPLDPVSCPRCSQRLR
jgi:hypothetical protein